MSKESVAARALLAHFNNQLAGRLVRRLLQNENKEAWARLSEEVLRLIPEAAKQTLWAKVHDFVTKEGQKHLDSEGFKKRATELLEANVSTWLPRAESEVIREQVNNYVQRLIRDYDIGRFLKEAPARFKALYDEETRRLAHAKAFENMAQVQLAVSSGFEAAVAAAVVNFLEKAEAEKKAAKKR